MTALSSSVSSRLAAIKAGQQELREAEQVEFPLHLLLSLFLMGTWEQMESENWSGFQALARTFAPIKIPDCLAYRKRFPASCMNGWQVQKISEILGCDWAIVAWTISALAIDQKILTVVYEDIRRLDSHDTA